MASTSPGSGASLPRSPQIPHMPGTQGYAVVSCHVERPLDDRVWQRYSALIRRRPAGFSITSLMRAPADGEDGALFVERARAAAAHGPFGHHTHWTSPTDARPTSGVPAEQYLLIQCVREELRLNPEEAFHWYRRARISISDPAIRTIAPPIADQPAWIRLDDGRRVLELPTTHSLGAAAKALVRPLPRVVHVHFHDYELLEPVRRAAIAATLRLLALRRRPVSLGELGAEREVSWSDVCGD